MFVKKYLLLIILLSILPFFFFFTSEKLVHTHDGLVHLPRLGAFFKAVLDGQIPVRWAGDLNYGYGMPLFNFIYHTPYLVGSLFLFLGQGLVAAFKLSLLVSFLLSGIFMFLFARALFNDDKKAFLVTLMYQFAPFHLVDVLIRASFGEVYAYTFLPLVLYGLTKYFLTKKTVYFLLSALATVLLIISHNSISLLFFGVAVAYCVFFASSRLSLFKSLMSLVLGLVISAYYWLPAIVEHKYTYGNLFMKDLYRDHFPAIWKFLVPNITDATFLQTDNLALQYGVFSTLAFFLGAYLLLKRRIKDKHLRKVVYFSFILTVGSLFFMLPVSVFVWENTSFLRQFQFPWRFLTVSVFSTSLLAAFFVPYLKDKLIYPIVAGLIVIVSVSYWIPKEGLDSISEKYYWNFPLNTTYYGETDVIWSAGPAHSYPKNRIAVIAGKGEIGDVSKRSNQQSFLLNAETEVSMLSNTQYFPGWRVYVDNATVPIQFQNPDHRGLITFTAPPGKHTVRIIFQESKVRFIADMISVSGIIFSGLLLLFRRRTL